LKIYYKIDGDCEISNRKKEHGKTPERYAEKGVTAKEKSRPKSFSGKKKEMKRVKSERLIVIQKQISEKNQKWRRKEDREGRDRAQNSSHVSNYLYYDAIVLGGESLRKRRPHECVIVGREKLGGIAGKSPLNL